MFIQLSVLILTIIGASVFSHMPQKGNVRRKQYIIFVCILLILQSGLRNVAVGPDTFQYKRTFESISMWTWTDVWQNFISVYVEGIGKDAGYSLFVKLFTQFISIDYQIYLLCVAIIFFTSFGYFLYANTKKIRDIVYAVLFYQVFFYTFFSITGIRQTIATAICLWSYNKCVKQQKIIPFLIYMFIASMIHQSALLFVLFYFIANYKNSRRLFKIVLIMLPFLFAGAKVFTSKLASLAVTDTYLGYADETTSGAWGFSIFYVSLILIGYIRYKNITNRDSEAYRVYNAVTLGLFFLPLTFVSAALMRVVQYFSFFCVLFFSLIFDKEEYKNCRIWDVLEMLFVMLLLYKLCTSTGNEYAFFWEYMPLGGNYE